MINAWSNGNSPACRRRGSKPLAVLSHFFCNLIVSYNEGGENMNLNEVEEKVENVETKANYILECNKIITSKQVMDMINEQLHSPTNSDLLKGFE